MQVPPRHAAIIRGPQKEVKENNPWAEHEQKQLRRQPIHVGRQQIHQPQVQQHQQQQQRHQQATRVIAYVARPPRCMYSADLLNLAEELNIKVQIYDIDSIDHPEWLPGTPTLETQHGQVYCGDAAFDWLLANAPPAQAQQSQQSQFPQRQQQQQQQQQVTPEEKQRQEAYGFLAPAVEEKPTPGGNLQQVFAESDRMGQIAEAAAAQPEQNAQAAFDALMNARS
jgi:hypothetical protein